MPEVQIEAAVVKAPKYLYLQHLALAEGESTLSYGVTCTFTKAIVVKIGDTEVQFSINALVKAALEAKSNA